MATEKQTPVAENTKTLTIKSSDGHEFVIAESVALMSETIKNMVEDGCAENTIPLSVLDGEILAKVVTYLNKHADYEALSNDDKKKLDEEFVDGMEIGVLFELIHSADYLSMKSLLELTTQKVAEIMKNKSVEWVRKTVPVDNDFKPEEEDRMRKELAWTFEGLDED